MICCCCGSGLLSSPFAVGKERKCIFIASHITTKNFRFNFKPFGAMSSPKPGSKDTDILAKPDRVGISTKWVLLLCEYHA